MGLTHDGDALPLYTQGGDELLREVALACARDPLNQETLSSRGLLLVTVSYTLLTLPTTYTLSTLPVALPLTPSISLLLLPLLFL